MIEREPLFALLTAHGFRPYTENGMRSTFPGDRDIAPTLIVFNAPITGGTSMVITAPSNTTTAFAVSSPAEIIEMLKNVQYSQPEIICALETTLRTVKALKPNDRSELDRRYAILLTDLEKVVAYCAHYITRQDAAGDTGFPGGEP